MEQPLYAIIVVSNPLMFRRRYELHNAFMRRMEAEKGVVPYVVECAFGERPHEVTCASNPRHIQVRTTDMIWHKEALINIGVSRLPADWRYMAWIDGDIAFQNEHWASDTIHALQHHPVVQLFQTAADLGSDDRIIKVYDGLAWSVQSRILDWMRNGKACEADPCEYDVPGHCGYAWACTRAAWEAMGGALLEVGILGSGDRHMAYAWLGKAAFSIPKGVHPNYREIVMAYEARCASFGGMLGYVRGNIVHYWHGKKADRRYAERWRVLERHNFDPLRDVTKNGNGVVVFTSTKPRLRTAIAAYFTCRSEDGGE
jgi:hypothetical protein